MEPPNLAQYPDTPVYDVNMLVQLIRVRPLTLWAWEQQLGMSSGEPSHDASKYRRRSERDLVALLWLRDMVIAGETPQEAAARLIAAQRNRGATGYLNSGALNSGALNTGALNQPSAYHGPTQATGALGSATYPRMNPGATPGMNTGMLPGVSNSQMTPPQAYTVPLDPRAGNPMNSASRFPQSDTRPGGMSGPLSADAFASAPQMGGPSGRLGSVYGAALEPPSFQPRGPSMSQSLNSQRELRPSIPQLLQSFARFDTARANAVLTEALRTHGVENVCIGLVQPAAMRISELWSKSELTNPEERFALNYLRAFMYTVYHSTQEPLGAPLAVVGCAPNETNEFGALLLAVLWRRAGLRVAYLGRGIDGDQLLTQRWPVTPAIVALTATSSQRIRALARISKRLGELPAPQPIFAYYGPIFTRNPDLRRKLTGAYLGDDAAMATFHVRQLLNMDVFGE